MREGNHKYKVGNSQNVPSSNCNGNKTQKAAYNIAKLSLSRTVNNNIYVPEFSFFVNQSKEIKYKLYKIIIHFQMNISSA